MTIFSDTCEKALQCEDCGKTYGKKQLLRGHVKETETRTHTHAHTHTHTHTRPYKCNICGKAFMQKLVLHGHINVHSVPHNSNSLVLNYRLF